MRREPTHITLEEGLLTETPATLHTLFVVVGFHWQVALWYQGWKDRFPENLRSDSRVMAQFNAALTLMDQVELINLTRAVLQIIVRAH